MDWEVPYTIGKLLELTCLNGLAWSIWVLKTQVMAKRKLGSQIDFWPLKVRNHPDLVAYRWHVTYQWKALNEGYNFSFDLSLIKGLKKKVIGFQICGSSNLGNFGTPNLGVLGWNDIWMLAPWPSIKNAIRGKVVASLKFEPWWILWVCVCSWFVRAPKCSNYALTCCLVCVDPCE